MIWRLRLAAARWLLAGCPAGTELYFRSNRVLTRNKRAMGVATLVGPDGLFL